MRVWVRAYHDSSFANKLTQRGIHGSVGRQRQRLAARMRREEDNLSAQAILVRDALGMGALPPALTSLSAACSTRISAYPLGPVPWLSRTLCSTGGWRACV
jgi:hypothetical protein